MEFSKYIVPVISGNESFGTGFLYKDYLITANHIVTNKINSSFRFDGNWYKLKTNSFIVFPSDEQWRYPNEAQDLFVCKTEIYGSDLILSRSSNKMNNYKYQGYYFDESSNDFMNVVTPELKLYHETAYNEKGEKLYNCFSCKGNVLKSSNSGGPLFESDVIIGMLIRSIKHQGGITESVFIKTDYILKEIEKGLIIYNEINNPG